jgi:hypothetical protein
MEESVNPTENHSDQAKKILRPNAPGILTNWIETETARAFSTQAELPPL